MLKSPSADLRVTMGSPHVSSAFYFLTLSRKRFKISYFICKMRTMMSVENNVSG